VIEGLLDSFGWHGVQGCGQGLDVEQPVMESGAGNGAYDVGRVPDQDRGLADQLRGQVLRDRGADEVTTIERPVDSMSPR